MIQLESTNLIFEIREYDHIPKANKSKNLKFGRKQDEIDSNVYLISGMQPSLGCQEIA